VQKLLCVLCGKKSGAEAGGQWPPAFLRGLAGTVWRMLLRINPKRSGENAKTTPIKVKTGHSAGARDRHIHIYRRLSYGPYKGFVVYFIDYL